MPSLRRIIKDATGENINLCQSCLDCDFIPADEVDVPLGSLVQMVLFNDEEVLTSKTLWSEAVLAEARYACRKGINLEAVLLALRDEATKRKV
jgi:heterodisulfide reductase subunit C